MKLQKSRTGAAVLGLTVSMLLGVAGAATAAAPTTEQLVDQALVSVGQSTQEVAAPDVTVDDAAQTAGIATDWGVVSVQAQEPKSVLLKRQGGAQLLSVLDEGDTEALFNVGLPKNVSLLPDGVGGYDLVARDMTYGAAVFGHVDAPWAVDAKGKRVATSYQLRGNTLVQTLHGSGISYPVVADPTVVRNCGIITCTWYVSVLKTREMSNTMNRLSTQIAGGLTAAAACAVISAPTGPGALFAGAFCGVASAIGGPVIANIFNNARLSSDCVTLSVGARAPLGHVDLSNQYCYFS